jgi:O-antigen/teichoic acid export membrane protein
MNKKFKDITSIGVASIVTTLIGGIFWFFMASILGAEKYGEVSYLISIGVIASTFALAGNTNTMIVYRAKGEKIQTTIFFISIISSIVSAIVLFLSVKNIEIGIYVLGYVIFSLTAAQLQGEKNYIKYSKLLITQKILMVGLAAGMFYLIGVQGIILGIGLSFLPYSFMVYKEFKKTKINFSILKKRSGFMINSFTLDIAGALHGSFDKIIIAPILGFTLLGNYQLGIQFVAVMTIIPAMIFTYTLPNDSTGNQSILIKKIIIIVSVILAIMSIVLTPIALPHIFPEYEKAIEIIQIMSISVIPITIVMTFISKFLGRGNSRIVLIGTGIYVGIQIPTILLLTELFGVNGTASSVVIANTAHAIYFIFIDRYYSRKQFT